MKRIFLMTICCLSILLCSCSLQEKEVPLRSCGISDFPETYVDKIGNIKFETNIIVGDDYQKKLLTGKAISENLSLKKSMPGLYAQDDYIDYSSDDVWSEKFDIYIKQKITRNMIQVFEKENPGELGNIEKCLDTIGASGIEIQKAAKIEEEQNCYLLTGRQTSHGIPIIDPFYLRSTEDAGAPVRILYVDGEVKKAQILYNYKIKSENTEVSLVDFEEIAASLKKHFDSILTDNRYMINEAELCFMIDVNMKKSMYDMVPVWLFTIREITNMNEQREFYEVIRADTAKRVVIE